MHNSLVSRLDTVACCHVVFAEFVEQPVYQMHQSSYTTPLDKINLKSKGHPSGFCGEAPPLHTPPKCRPSASEMSAFGLQGPQGQAQMSAFGI